jgi:hypothetical protein
VLALVASIWPSGDHSARSTNRRCGQPEGARSAGAAVELAGAIEDDGAGAPGAGSAGGGGLVLQPTIATANVARSALID